MRSYKERQFRKAPSSPKLGFWPHCKNSDYNLLDDRQVCWVVQVRTGPELPGKQEQSSVVGRQLCTSMGRQAWRKGQLLVAWLLAVACGLKSRWLCLGDWRKQHFKCSRARLMGRASGGVAGVLVVSNRPHTGSGHCAQTWSTRWLLDYTLECAVGAEWHWACTHTHTHTHREGLCGTNRRQHSKIKEERPLPINRAVPSVNKAWHHARNRGEMLGAQILMWSRKEGVNVELRGWE